MREYARQLTTCQDLRFAPHASLNGDPWSLRYEEAP
jgi:hypothetical protein